MYRPGGDILGGVIASSAALVPLDVPVGWSDPPDVNMVHALLLFGGVTLLLFVVITVAVYVPSLVRGEPITPGAPALENHWLGGPRAGTAELSSPSGEDTETGGASGRW